MKIQESKTNMLSKGKLIISVAVVSLGFFMTTLDSSVVNVALPVIHICFHSEKISVYSHIGCRDGIIYSAMVIQSRIKPCPLLLLPAGNTDRLLETHLYDKEIQNNSQ
jgi:hypothetical protein